MSSIDKLQLENLTTKLVEQGADELYLSMGSTPMLKIAKQMTPASPSQGGPANQDVLTAVKIEELILPLINQNQKETLNKEKSLVFSHTFNNNLRFKINLFYQKSSLAASLRLISNKVYTLQELGLPSQIASMIDVEDGLVIVSGPVNSGKSTTLAAMVEYLNNNKSLRILTLEKPIEYIYTSKKSIIQQREVGKDTHSFEEGLEDCFEATLDVVVVSQIEDKQTAAKILELAQQGYLVICVMTANSVLDVLMKFTSFFESGEQKRLRDILSFILKAIVCQKLITIAKDKQSSKVVAVEVLFNTDAVRLSIQNDRLNQINNILGTSAKQGMILFEQSLANLVKTGKVDLQTALEHVIDEEGFKQLVV